MSSPVLSSALSVGDAGGASSPATTAESDPMRTSSSPPSGYAQNSAAAVIAGENVTEEVLRPGTSGWAKEEKTYVSQSGDQKSGTCFSGGAVEDAVSSSECLIEGGAEGMIHLEDGVLVTSGSTEQTGSDSSPCSSLSAVVGGTSGTQIHPISHAPNLVPSSMKAEVMQEQPSRSVSRVSQGESDSQFVAPKEEHDGASADGAVAVGPSQSCSAPARSEAPVLPSTEGEAGLGDSCATVTSPRVSTTDANEAVKRDAVKSQLDETFSLDCPKELAGMLRDSETEGKKKKKRKDAHTSGDNTPAGKSEGEGHHAGLGKCGGAHRGDAEDDESRKREKKKKKSDKPKGKRGDGRDVTGDHDAGPKRKKHKTHTGDASPTRDAGREKKRRTDRSVSVDRGHGEDPEFDEGDALELTEYVKANMDKLRGMYEQQVSAASDLIAQQTEKSGIDPLSNKGTASELMAAPAPHRVPLASLFHSCSHSQKLAARKLVSSLVDYTASTGPRSLSPPRISYEELIEYAQEHCKESSGQPASSVDQSSGPALTPRPGQAPAGQVRTRHELIHQSDSTPCCMDCCPVCLNYLLVPLVVSSARQKASAEDSDSLQVTGRTACCCLAVQLPTEPSSRSESSDSEEASEKRASRSHRASGGWTYADQFRKFNKLKGQSHYTSGDDQNDDEYVPSTVRSSSTSASSGRRPSVSAALSPAAGQTRSLTGGEGGSAAKHVSRIGQGGGNSLAGRASASNRMQQQASASRPYRVGGGLGMRPRPPLERQSVWIDRGSMFGTADQRPEKWVPRSEAMLRRLQQAKGAVKRRGELGKGGDDGPHSRGRGPAPGAPRQSRKSGQSSSSSDSDSSSDSSSSSDEDPQKNGKKTAGRAKRPGSDTTDARESLKARLQKFCRQADGQKLPVLKEACAALFVTAMKDLCLEPWSQHYAIRILLRSADSVFPQFIKSNGIVLLREWMEEVATSPESVEEHEGLLASALKVLQRLRPARQDLLQSKMPFLVRAIAQRKKLAKCDFEACSEEVSAVAEKLFLTWKAAFGAQASEGNSSAGAVQGGATASRAQPLGASASSESVGLSSEKTKPESIPTARSDGTRQTSVIGPTSKTGSLSLAGRAKTGQGGGGQLGVGEGKVGDACGAGQGTQGAVNASHRPDASGKTTLQALAQSAKKATAGGETKAKAEEELMSLAKLGENLQDTAKRRRLEEEGTYSPTADDEVQVAAPARGGADLPEEERQTRVRFSSLNASLVGLVFFDPLEEPLVVKQSLAHGDELTGEEAAQHLTQLRHTQADADKFDKLRRMHTYKEIGRCAAAVAGEPTKGAAPAPKHTVHPQVTMKFTVPLRIDFAGCKEPHRHPNPSPPPDPAPPGAAAIPVEPPQQLFPCVTAFSFIGIPIIASDAQGPPPLELSSAPVHSPATAGQGPAEADFSAENRLHEKARSPESGDGNACGRSEDTPGDQLGADGVPGGLVAAGAASSAFAVPQGPVQAMMAPPGGVPFFPPPCFPPIPGPGYPPLCPPFAALPPPNLVGRPPPGVFGMMPPQGEAPPFPVRPGTGPPRGGFGGSRGGRGGGRGGRGGGRGWTGGGGDGGRRRGGKGGRLEEGGGGREARR